MMASTRIHPLDFTCMTSLHIPANLMLLFLCSAVIMVGLAADGEEVSPMFLGRFDNENAAIDAINSIPVVESKESVLFCICFPASPIHPAPASIIDPCTLPRATFLLRQPTSKFSRVIFLLLILTYSY